MPVKPVMQLGQYDNSWYHPGGSLLKRTLWFFLGQPILRGSWMPFSGMRVRLLRIFGARIGTGVVIKPAVDVKYPWHLEIGNDCWIGERVWIDNLTRVQIANNVCISQGAYLCTGNHDWSDPAFGLIIAPVVLSDGAWAGACCILTPGTVLGVGAVAAAGAVVSGNVPDFHIMAGNPAQFRKLRVVKSNTRHTPAEVISFVSAEAQANDTEVCS